MGTFLFSLKQSYVEFAALLEKCATEILVKWDKESKSNGAVKKELSLWRLSVFGLLPPQFRTKLVGLGALEVSALEANIRSLEAELYERRVELWNAVKNRVGKDVGVV